MRTIETKSFAFSELSKEAQGRAIEDNRDINTEDFDWWDGVYEQLREFLSYVGIEVGEIYFGSLHCQGEHARVNAEIPNPLETIEKINAEAWRSDFVKMDSPFDKWGDLRDRHKVYLRDCVSVSMGPGYYNSRDNTRANVSESYYSTASDRFTEIHGEIEGYFDELARDIEHLALKWLRNECEYLNGDEAVAESLEANGYEFTESGEIH